MSSVQRGMSAGVTVILAIAVLYFWQLPNGAIDAMTRLGFVVIPTVLALAFGGGAIYDVIRGRQAILKVDRDGIWVKGMPRRMAWSDVADIRTEEIISYTSLQNASGTSLNLAGWEIELGKGSVTPLQKAVDDGEVSTRLRLGVVPRDESLVPDRDALGAINAWADSKDEETAQLIGRHAIEHAPFGLDSREMDAIFEDVLTEIRKFHEVGELSDLEGIIRPAAAQ